jgi:hypothetical protein
LLLFFCFETSQHSACHPRHHTSCRRLLTVANTVVFFIFTRRGRHGVTFLAEQPLPSSTHAAWRAATTCLLAAAAAAPAAAAAQQKLLRRGSCQSTAMQVHHSVLGLGCWDCVLLRCCVG